MIGDGLQYGFEDKPHRFKPSRHLRDCCKVCGEPKVGGEVKHLVSPVAEFLRAHRDQMGWSDD